MGIKTGGNVGFEEGGERSLGAGGEDARLLDKGDDGSTGRDRCQTTAGQRANGNDVGTNLTLQPSQNGNLQRSGQGAFGTGEPGLQGGLNIGGEVDKDTAASTKAETSPNLGIESSINRRREECGQRSLGGSAQDNICGDLGGGEDTLKGDKEVALGGDVSASGISTDSPAQTSTERVTEASPSHHSRRDALTDASRKAAASARSQAASSALAAAWIAPALQPRAPPCRAAAA